MAEQLGKGGYTESSFRTREIAEVPLFAVDKSLTVTHPAK